MLENVGKSVREMRKSVKLERNISEMDAPRLKSSGELHVWPGRTCCNQAAGMKSATVIAKKYWLSLIVARWTAPS